MNRYVNRYVRENISRAMYMTCAAITIVLMALIFYFIGSRAYQTFTDHGVNPVDFFIGTHYDPRGGHVGAFALLAGSFLVTVFAVLVSAPISVGVAVFISEMAPAWARSFMQPVLELFLGIPSIIYGFLGLVILVPAIAHVYNALAGAYLYNGYGLPAAALVLAIMILPTVTTISADAIRGLPGGLREASAAVGATRWQTITRTLIPAATPGILTGVILGTGRAIGETLAVSFVIGGNPNQLPFAFSNYFPYLTFNSTSSVTVQLLFDFFEVKQGDLDYDALWTLAFILLLITVLLVIASRTVAARSAFVVRQQRDRRGSGWRRFLPGGRGVAIPVPATPVASAQ
ncbi:MAG TPA: phosphate ABC transporter permease subunit PstC [Ktedonobacterales bacterium]